MLLEHLPDIMHGLLDRLEKLSGFEAQRGFCRERLPEFIAALLMHARVAPKRKGLRARSEIDQDGVALGSAGHAQLQKALLRGGQRIHSMPVGHTHANFPGSALLSPANGRGDLGFVELVDEFFGMHDGSPTSAGTPSAAAATAAGKSSPARAAASKSTAEQAKEQTGGI